MGYKRSWTTTGRKRMRELSIFIARKLAFLGDQNHQGKYKKTRGKVS